MSAMQLPEEDRAAMKENWRMSVSMTNLKISTRILLLSTLPIVGILTLAVVQRYAERVLEKELATVRAANQLASTTAAVHYNTLQLRRLEKDFLERGELA